jgi:spore maturation protein SpmA
LFQTNGNLTYELTPISVLIFRMGLGNKSPSNIRLAVSVTMSIVLAVIMTAVTLLTNAFLKREED